MTCWNEAFPFLLYGQHPRWSWRLCRFGWHNWSSPFLMRFGYWQACHVCRKERRPFGLRIYDTWVLWHRRWRRKCVWRWLWTPSGWFPELLE